MEAYTAYARGRGLGLPYAFFPENQHLILITDNCSVHVCMNTIDYNVLTGIAVIAAARYFARARESFRDD